MIVDIHMHTVPYLGGLCGCDSIATHLMHLQKVESGLPAQAHRRASDNAVVERPKLWDDGDPGPGGKYDVGFRVGRFGRFEYTVDGVDYYAQFYPPSMQDMVAPPEFLLAQMDYVGVDVGVLQNCWVYGELNDHISEAVKKYPRRFVGQAQVQEAEAYSDGEIAKLRCGVKELGLTGGLYFGSGRFFETGFRDHLDDSKFFPLWEEVRELRIPVFWDLWALEEPGQPPGPALERYWVQMRRLSNWAERFPEIPCVLVHGAQLRVFWGNGSLVPVPEEILDVWRKPNVHLEVLFPVQTSYPRPGANHWDYPYAQVQPLIRQLYQTLGPEKLLWGSDLPNVERNCTYRQSLDYLVRYCTFITENHMDMITGGNALRLLRISS